MGSKRRTRAVSPWESTFFFKAETALYKPAVGKNRGESPGGRQAEVR
jgi:hypothetical protein